MRRQFMIKLSLFVTQIRRKSTTLRVAVENLQLPFKTHLLLHIPITLVKSVFVVVSIVSFPTMRILHVCWFFIPIKFCVVEFSSAGYTSIGRSFIKLIYMTLRNSRLLSFGRQWKCWMWAKWKSPARS